MKGLFSAFLVFLMFSSFVTVQGATPKVYLSGVKAVYAKTYIKVNFKLNTTAKVTARVYNAKSKVVKVLVSSKSYKKGLRYAKWNLKDSKGNKVLAGTYKIALNAKNTRNHVSKTLTVKIKTSNLVNFNDVPAVDQLGETVVWENPKGSDGTVYEGKGLLFGITSIRELNLNKDFANFNCKTVIPNDDVKSRNFAKLLFYLDGELAFDTGWINTRTVINVKLDVNNAEKLKIKYIENLVGYPEIPPRLGIVEGFFTKK